MKSEHLYWDIVAVRDSLLVEISEYERNMQPQCRVNRLFIRTCTRPYYVDSSIDSFPFYHSRSLELVPAYAIELLAYYRGEPVTEQLVREARDELGCMGEPPLPFVSLGKVRLDCIDDTYTPILDRGTLARHFELVADLLEVFPDVDVIKLPFHLHTVQHTLNYIEQHSLWPINEDVIACIKYLRPENTEFLLFHPSAIPASLMTPDLVRYINSGLDEETKIANSQLAHLIPDKNIVHVASWTYRHDMLEVLSVLLVNYPSVHLWALCNPPTAYYSYSQYPFILDLILHSTFEDEYPVCEPETWTRNIILEPFWGVLLSINNARDFRHYLASFGVIYPVLDNDELNVSLPFDTPPFIDSLSDEARITIISRLSELDPTFNASPDDFFG